MIFLCEQGLIMKDNVSIEIKRAMPADYPGILALQYANRPEQLSEADRQQGFIVSDFTTESLDTINKALGILVATAGDDIAGFVCMVPTDPLPAHPVIQAMFKTFPQQVFRGETLDSMKVFIYGPVCINKKWRGRGILKQLFEGVQAFAGSDYDAGVAFINDANQHSLSAHVQGLKMTPLTPFDCDGHRFQLVAFSTESMVE